MMFFIRIVRLSLAVMITFIILFCIVIWNIVAHYPYALKINYCSFEQLFLLTKSSVNFLSWNPHFKV